MQPSLVAARVSTFQQSIRRIREMNLVADDIIQRTILARERSLLYQQQLREAESRIDHLLVKLKQNSHPPVGGTTSSREPVAVPLDPPFVQQLKQRNELLRQTAHDLKSNFSIISFASYQLHSNQIAEDQQEMIGMLHRNVQQATQVVMELLDLTRLEAGQEQRQLTRFDVAEVLGNLVETLQPLAHQRGLWLQSQGPDHLLIEGDSVKLQRIVQNLLLNAIKYTRRGGVTLEWASELTNMQWQLSVTDTGPGLSTGGNQATGEGMGLLIVRKLCALLDGQFNVEESPGTGSCFTLVFPQQYSAR